MNTWLVFRRLLRRAKTFQRDGEMAALAAGALFPFVIDEQIGELLL